MATGTAKKTKPRKKSVLRNIRTARRRAVFNRANLTRVRSAIRRMRAAIAAGNQPAAQGLLSATYSELDRAIRKRALRENTANRYKSRIALAIAAMKA